MVGNTLFINLKDPCQAANERNKQREAVEKDLLLFEVELLEGSMQEDGFYDAVVRCGPSQFTLSLFLPDKSQKEDNIGVFNLDNEVVRLFGLNDKQGIFDYQKAILYQLPDGQVIALYCFDHSFSIDDILEEKKLPPEHGEILGVAIDRFKKYGYPLDRFAVVMKVASMCRDEAARGAAGQAQRAGGLALLAGPDKAKEREKEQKEKGNPTPKAVNGLPPIEKVEHEGNTQREMSRVL